MIGTVALGCPYNCRATYRSMMIRAFRRVRFSSCSQSTMQSTDTVQAYTGAGAFASTPQHTATSLMEPPSTKIPMVAMIRVACRIASPSVIPRCAMHCSGRGPRWVARDQPPQCSVKSPDPYEADASAKATPPRRPDHQRTQATPRLSWGGGFIFWQVLVETV